MSDKASKDQKLMLGVEEFNHSKPTIFFPQKRFNELKIYLEKKWINLI